MAMTAGTVSIAADGAETKSGMAEAVYDALKTETEATTGTPIPDGADGAAIKGGLALIANAVATGVTGYIQSNAQLKVFAADSGLQKSTAVGVLTAQPDADATFGAVL